MSKHPCSDGLTPACFKAYPKWARQALAYKFLHILVPKQLTKRLPRGLRLPLIGDRATIPPDFIVPPGMAIPPDFNYPEDWTEWGYFDYGFDTPPWELFPEDWQPGDPLPDGVKIDPGTEFPPGWAPGDPLPPGIQVVPGTEFPPGWAPGDSLPPGVKEVPIVELPPGWKPTEPPPPAYDQKRFWKEPPWAHSIIPPRYIQVWEPGPIFVPKSSPVGFDIGDLLINQGPNTNKSYDLGHAWYAVYMGLRIITMGHYKIHAVDLRVGKHGAPDGSLQLEIWQAGTDYKPINILVGGTSDSKVNSALPDYSHSQEYVRFLFASKPECFSGIRYDVILHTTNTIDGSNYLTAGQWMYNGGTYWHSQNLSTWYSFGGYSPTFKIWGEAQ